MDSRMNQFVRISRKNSRYFEYEDGTPFVPVGMNLCFERFSGDDAEISQSTAAGSGVFRRTAGISRGSGSAFRS
ncbi:MAG: hypothetical protein V8T86_11170 [Victivallis sp.]